MNPDCHIDLFTLNVDIGEKAHIIEFGAGGPTDFENLILLCPNCHTVIDKTRDEDTIPKLKSWKSERNSGIQRRFTYHYNSFDEMSEVVKPLLERNHDIFITYGPNSSDETNPPTRAEWRSYEPEIIANNLKLLAILKANRRLIQNQNQEIIHQFDAHVKEFIMTRQDPTPIRRLLFPEELMSIFGLHPFFETEGSNVGLIQSIIAHCSDIGEFVDLTLHPNPMLAYKQDGRIKIMHLDDGPYVRQFWFSNYLAKGPRLTVPTSAWMFFLNWVSNNGIEYKFEDPNDLTKIVLNGEIRVKLVEEYTVSLANLHELVLEPGWLIVNVYYSDLGGYSRDAASYAKKLGWELLTKNEFFIFAHNNIK